MDLFLFTFSLVFLFILFKTSLDISFGDSFNYLYLLGMTVTGSYIASSIRLKCDLALRKGLIHEIKEKFSKAAWEPKNAPILARLISRDLSVLLDFISSALKLVYFPVAVVTMLTIAYWIEGLGGLFALSFTSLFLVLSIYIAKKSIVLANNIYATSKLRIDKASWFVRYRPYLKNWDESGTLHEINNISNAEIKLRNRDSFIRSFDLYTILFGSAVPVLFLLLIATVFSKQIDHELLIVLWFSGPMISLVMEMGRFASDYTIANNAFEEVYLNIKNELLNNNEHILLNDNWEIWEGSLADNVLHNLNPFGFSLSHELGLDSEFNHRINHLNELKIGFLGKNVSEGQKTRILLIRAIHMATMLARPLFINISLNSLDPITCRKFYDLLPKLRCFCEINLTTEQERFFKAQISRSIKFETLNYDKHSASITDDKIDGKKIESNPFENFIHNLFSLMPPAGLFFIIPAVFLSLNSYMVISPYSVIAKLGLLTLITSLALIIAPSLGYVIESINRKKAIKLQDKLLRLSNLADLNDLLQRISKDFTVMIERISWYVHDIFWYLGLVLTAFFAVIYTSGFVGILVNGLFIGVILLLCKLFARTIKNARIEAVEGINRAINVLQNITTLGQINHSVFEEKKRYWCTSGFQTLLGTHLKMVETKVSFSNLISASTGLFIIILVLISSIRHLNQSEFVFLLASLLAIATTIVNLFQAITGLNSQLQSYIRLYHIPLSQHATPKGEIKLENNYYIISGFVNSKLSINYRKISLKEGKVYSLSGHSGLGKTEFLKTIANFNDSEMCNDDDSQKIKSVKVMYLNHEAIDLLRTLNLDNVVAFLVSKIETEHFKIILLDEVFRHVDLKETHAILEQLKKIISISKSTLIVVDHRFEFTDQLVMKNIL